MNHTIPSKHIKTLSRRLEYLQGLGEEANSYDKAEASALKTAVEALGTLKNFQIEYGVDLQDLEFILAKDET